MNEYRYLWNSHIYYFNLQTKNIMKKTFLYFCLLFIVQTAFAADSLYVREQQIPILIDRIDNVLYEMR